MAPRRARYLSHSEVVVDPALDVREWTLSETGRARVRRLVGSDVFAGTRRVVTSAERKAVETAAPMAEAIGCDLEVRAAMHENDRSATGYLPPPEFEATADAFFARPAESIRGWERAIDAQRRIVAEVEDVLEQQGQGDVLFVGHGGVGTLCLCHYLGEPIGRSRDQPAGGASLFTLDIGARRILHVWRRLETFVRP